MLHAILALLTVSSPPRDVVIEHCFSGNEDHCFIEVYGGDAHVRAMVAEADGLAFEASGLKEHRDLQYEVVTEDQYQQARGMAFGSYLYEPTEDGNLRVTAVDFPDWFVAFGPKPDATEPAGLERELGPRQVIWHADPQLADYDKNWQCQAGVILQAGKSGSTGFIEVFGLVYAVTKNPTVAAGAGAVGYLVGAASGALEGFKDNCVSSECQPTQPVPSEPAPEQPTPAVEPPTSCDPGTTSCPEPAEPKDDSTPMPDDAPTGSVVVPGGRTTMNPRPGFSSLINPGHLPGHRPPPRLPANFGRFPRGGL